MQILFLFFAFSFLNLNCSQPESLISKSEENLPKTTTQNQNFTAKVIRITDGDTLEVLYGELPVTIRLAHIDCPEKRGNQPFGKKAKQALSDLCFGKEIRVEFTGEKDRNGRYISVIYTQQGLNINQEMVKLGMAWHFKRYSSDETYADLENEARKNKVGLWAEPNPTPPWDWRKN